MLVETGRTFLDPMFIQRSEALDGSPHNCRWCSEKASASSLVTNVRPIVGRHRRGFLHKCHPRTASRSTRSANRRRASPTATMDGPVTRRTVGVCHRRKSNSQTGADRPPLLVQCGDPTKRQVHLQRRRERRLGRRLPSRPNQNDRMASTRRAGIWDITEHPVNALIGPSSARTS